MEMDEFYKKAKWIKQLIKDTFFQPTAGKYRKAV